jgi:hypothetical protein
LMWLTFRIPQVRGRVVSAIVGDIVRKSRILGL